MQTNLARSASCLLVATLLLGTTALAIPSAEARNIYPVWFKPPEQIGQACGLLLEASGKLGESFDPEPAPLVVDASSDLGVRSTCRTLNGGSEPRSGSAFGHPSSAAGQADENGDGVGDEWAEEWSDLIDAAIDHASDLDGDQLTNLREFRWELVPVCLPYNNLPLPPGVDPIQNCRDHEADPADGTGGDGWFDGSEVVYWNNAANDDSLAVEGLALFDPDRLLDTDGDTIRNLNDTDSDDDSLLDGAEYLQYGTYPEFPDSDCRLNVTACTPSSNSGFYDVGRQGSPGSKDGLDDAAEVAMWNGLLGTGAWAFDLDLDGIHSLLDPDSDDDGLLDGEEALAHGTRPDLFDSDNDGLSDSSEVRSSQTDPNAWDSDGDALPDGWEVRHGLNPHDGTDAGLDGDQDSYNPTGTLPANPWTNLDEYRYGIPGDWNVPEDGVWWLGTDPTAEDTDGDGVLDGVEVHYGSDPTNGASVDPRGHGANGSPATPVWQANPTNQNLPEDQMDPTNLQYLQEGRADAAAQAEETVEVVDHLISAAIAGNVTQALNVLYNETAVGPPLRNATQMVQLAQEAVLNLVKCAPEGAVAASQASTEQGKEAGALVQASATAFADNPSDPAPLTGFAESLPGSAGTLTETLTGALPEAPEPGDVVEHPDEALLEVAAQADDAAGCVSETLLPFLDALLERTLESVPLVEDLVAELEEETIPGIVATADAILPIELQATAQAFLERPVTTATKTALGLPAFLSDPQNIQAAAAQTVTAADLLISGLLKPSGRHPQFLYDFTHGETVPGGIPLVWQTVVEHNPPAEGVDAVATIDSLAFNLYTKRSGNELVTAMPVGKRTCIQLDSSTATRDIGGCDLYATLSFSPVAVAPSLGTPTPGTRFTPTLRIEAAVPTAQFHLEVLGYLQLPNSPTVLVLGYDTNVAGSSQGLPAVWEATLNNHDAGEGANRTLAATLSFVDARLAIPLRTVVASFDVDENAPGKPVVGTDETVLETVSGAMANRVSFDVRRGEAGSNADVQVAITSSAAMPLGLQHHDTVGDWEGILNLQATDLPAGPSRIVASDAPTALSWTWSAAAATDDVTAGYLESVAGAPTRAFAVSATDLPAVAAVTSSADAHRHQFQASAAPSDFQFLLARGSDSCDALDVGAALHAAFDYTSQACAVGRLAGYSQVVLDATGTLAHAAGTRPAAHAQATALRVKDGNDLFLHAGSSPASWDARLALAGDRTQDLAWSASGVVPSLQFQADLDQGSRHALLQADLADVPGTVRATLDLATGQGALSASDHVGSTALAFTTTGSAPTQASSSDYLRLRILPDGQEAPDVESAWKATGAKSLVARVAPNGTFEVTGDYEATRPLSVLYHDDTHDLALDASGLTGPFGYWLSADAAGRMEFHQAASSAPASVTFSGRMPNGRIAIDLASVPERIAASIDLPGQHASVSGSGAIGHVGIRYATGSQAPTPPASGNSIILQDAATGERGAALQLDGIQSITATRLVDRLTIDSLPASASSLLVQMEDASGAVRLEASQHASHVDVQHPEGGLAWALSASSATTFAFKAALDVGPRFLDVAATSAPGQLSSTWTTRSSGAFDATVTHSATSMPSLSIVDFRGNPASPNLGAGWRFHALDLPAQSQVHFEPGNGVARASFRNADAQSAAVGHVEASFTELRDALSAISGQGLWMDQAGSAMRAALVADGLKTLDAPLLLDASGTASPRLDVERSAAGDFRVNVASEAQAASYKASAVNAAPSFHFGLRAGSAAGDGFSVSGTSSAASGPVTARLERAEGLDLSFATSGTTPATFTFAWSAGSPVQLTSPTGLSMVAQFAEALATAPWTTGGDFVAVKWNGAQDAQPRFGARLSGLQAFLADDATHRIQATGDATVAAFSLDFATPSTRLLGEASDLGPQQETTWNPDLRTFHHANTAAMGSLRVQEVPASGNAPRLLVSATGLPAGTTDFTQAAGLQSFLLSAPAAITRFKASLDAGASTPLQVLSGEGAFLDASAATKPLQLSLSNVKQAEGNLVASPWPFVAAETTGAGAAKFRLNGAGLFTATLGSLPAGVARIEWPNPATTNQLRLAASGVAGVNVQAGAAFGQESGQVNIPASPASWTFSVTPAGALDYVAGVAASSLEASGAFRGTAHRLTATSVPTEVHVAPQNGLRTGSVTATGISGVGRLTLALATSGSGAARQLPKPSTPNADLLTVDASDAGGLLYVDLPGLKSASWNVPAGASATPAAVQASLDLAAATSRRAVVQFVHPEHQTRLDAANGLPALSTIALQRSLQEWSLASNLGSKPLQAQHQDTRSGSLKASLSGSGMLTVAPKANRALSWAGDAAASLGVQSQWNQGAVQATLSNVPSSFAVDANALATQTGSASALGSGTVGRANIFLVPDATQSANRIWTPSDHAAVELMGKAPYLSLNVANLQSFGWTVPSATSQGPVSATVQRSAGAIGATLVVLSGSREDVTAHLLNPAATVSLAMQQSGNAPGTVNPQPVGWTTTSSGGSTGRVDVTHVDADTGQVLSSYVTGAAGTTTLSATGAEPARITISSTQPLGSVGLETTDVGTGLKLVATNPTTQMLLLATRGTCGATSPTSLSVSTQGTGRAGPTFLRVGDKSRVPADRSGNYIDVRCDGTDIGAGLRLPFVQDLLLGQTPCGIKATGIPANTPMPLEFQDTRARYKVQVQSQSPSGGFLSIHLECQSFDYSFVGLNGAPAGVARLLLEYERANSNAPCMQLEARCINRAALDGRTLSDTATGYLTALGGGPGLQLYGSAAPQGTLDVRFLMEKAARTTSFDFEVQSAMSLGKLVFLRSDVERQRVDGPSPNMIVHINNPSQDTFFAKLEKPNNVEATLHLDPDTMHVTTEYHGTSGRGLDFYYEDPGCRQQRMTLSNLPNDIDFEFLNDGLGAFYARTTESSHDISSARYAARAGASCSNSNGLLDTFVMLTGVPDGAWTAGWLFGAAGFVRVNGVEGKIGGADIGLAVPGEANKYVSLHLGNVGFGIEWDLDGDTRFPGVPAYVFADNTFGIIALPDFMTGSLRIRMGDFGVGVGGVVFYGGFQLSFKPTNLLFLQPPVSRAGFICGYPTGEILLWDRWWTIPIPLWGGCI